MGAWSGLFDNVFTDGPHTLQFDKASGRKRLARVFRRPSMDDFKELVRTMIQSRTTTLGTDPFLTVIASAVVTVTHTNHRFATGDSITISGVAAAIDDIPASEFNASHVITVTTDDAYTITLTTTGTAGASGGGAAVVVTQVPHFALFGDTALKQRTRVTQPADSDNLGGVRTVELQTKINRAITAADGTTFDGVVTQKTAIAPASYPVDAAGNGGGGRLGV